MKHQSNLISPDLVEVLLDLSPLFILRSKTPQNKGNGDDGVALETVDDVARFVAIDPSDGSLEVKLSLRQARKLRTLRRIATSIYQTEQSNQGCRERTPMTGASRLGSNRSGHSRLQFFTRIR